MKIQVCKPNELGSDEIALWRKWQAEDPRLSSAFLCPEYAVAFGRHNEQARVAVLLEGEQTVGFFPYEQHRLRVGTSFAYDFSDCQAVIATPGLQWHGKTLMDACHLSVFEFDHLVAHQVEQFAPRSVVLEPAPVIDLSPGFDAWLSDKRARSSARFKKLLQKQRKLARDVGTLDFVYSTRSHEDLNTLMEWKGAQYVRTGRANRFAKPWFREFVEDMFGQPSDTFSLTLSRLNAGGRTAALYLSLRNGTTITGWFPTHDVALSPLSPGMTCLLQLLETAAGDGVTKFELGEGAADYKEWFKNYEDQVAEGWSETRSPLALLRRAEQAPKRAALNFVLDHEHVRVAARETLNRVGAMRARLQ